MKQQPSSKKSIIIIAVVIVLTVAAYFYFSGSPTNSADSSLSTSGGAQEEDASNASGQVLTLLGQINSLKIDTSIFTSEVYKSLVDHTVVVPEQSVGKPNPFAPLPGSAPTTPSNTSTGTGH